jgi:hypothetical protein
MENLRQVVEALRACDRTLRAAISVAASEADPEQLNRVVGWLREIQRILHEASSNDSSPLVSNSVLGQESAQERVIPSGKSQSGARREKYPLFFKDSDSNLVKVGWSKKSRDEYEHKAPRSAISTVAKAIAEAAKNRKRIVMEKLIPFHDPVSGVTLPDYQAYIVLAWLRSTALVIQHGRQGYTVANGLLNDGVIERLWDSIPAR